MTTHKRSQCGPQKCSRIERVDLPRSSKLAWTMLASCLVVASVAGCGSDAAPSTTAAPLTSPVAAADDASNVTTPPDDESTSSAPDQSPQQSSPVDGSDGVPLSEIMFPNVTDAEAQLVGTTWTFSVTISSPYDSPERYADAWRVVGPDGTVYGERILTHDHAGEQPFTRSLDGVEIPDDVDEVMIEGRDLVNGYGGGTMYVPLER